MGPSLSSHDYAKSPLVSIEENSNSSLTEVKPAAEEQKSEDKKAEIVEVEEKAGETEMKEDDKEMVGQDKTNDGEVKAEEKDEKFNPEKTKLEEPLRKFAPKDLLNLLRNIDVEIHSCEANIKEENEKRSKHRIDDCRRVHNYDEFITTFLSMLAEQGILADLIEKDMNPKSSKDENSVHENGTGSNANSSSSKKNSNSKVKSGNNNSSSSTTKNKVGRPKLTNKSRRK